MSTDLGIPKPEHQPTLLRQGARHDAIPFSIAPYLRSPKLGVVLEGSRLNPESAMPKRTVTEDNDLGADNSEIWVPDDERLVPEPYLRRSEQCSHLLLKFASAASHPSHPLGDL